MANYTQPNYDPSQNGFWRGTVDGAPNFGYPRNYYYADTIRSLFLAFENFFNDLKVIRYDKFQVPTKVINVPIKFGPRKKSHDFRTEQESGDKYYISMPNLAYKLDSMEFDAERAKGLYETRAFYDKDLENAGIVCDMQEKFWSDVQPVPYNISVGMEANCENMSDALQIVEQICARFSPACFMDLKEFWFFNKRRSIKMLLNGVTWEIQSDAMGEEEWRQIKVNFSFKMEAVLYKPVKDAKIIERINTYVTLNKGDFMYHNVTFGDKDGSLDNPYNFSNVYKIFVTNAYVLNGSPVTTYDASTSAYTTTYDYIQTEQLTTYGEDAKLLKKVVTRWIPAGTSAEGPLAWHKRALTASEDCTVIREEVQLGPDNKPLKDADGNIITVPIEVNVHVGEVSGYTTEKSTTYSAEWMTTKDYEYIGGYGNLKDPTVEFGDKILYDQYDQPYSAYYSKYSEEGTYTSSSADFAAGKADYYYNFDKKTTEIDFDGSKYKVEKK